MKRYKRNWLNPMTHADTGSVASSIHITTDKDGIFDFDAELVIRDCSRQISLDVGIWVCQSDKAKGKAYTLREAALRRKKLAVLKSHIEFIEQGLDEYEEKLS